MGKFEALRWGSACAVGAAVCLHGSLAQAGGALGPNGSAIDTSRYGIDLYQGAVWGGSRLTSLGGSMVANAYDVDGMLQNAAAPAVRPFFSVTHFDYWLGFGLTFPSSLSNMDFFNSGAKTGIANSPDSLVYVTPALILQFGTLGIGANVEYQAYSLGEVQGPDGTVAKLFTRFTQTHLQVANSLLDGELVLGAGLRILDNRIVIGTGGTETSPTSAAGLGAEVGAVYQPFGEHFKLGASYRSAISARSTYSSSATLSSGNDVIMATSTGTIYLPESANLPWDINLGFSYDLGDGRPNTRWQSDADLAEKSELEGRLELLRIRDLRDSDLAKAQTDNERKVIEHAYELERARIERRMAQAREDAYWTIQERLAVQSRHVAMVTASLLLSGAVENSVGVESFINQTVNRSGESVVASPRLGSEVEVIPDFLRLRSGTYLEPTRFETSTVRAHYTGGFDVPLGVWNVFGLWPDDYRWRLAGALDVARDFSTFSLSVAGWYPRHRGTVKRPPPRP
jgi:hypothetical protein